jgi:Fe-S-cluster-containing dehydrogenase component
MARERPFPTARLNSGEAKAISYDSTKCIGCRQCVQACQDRNDLPRAGRFSLSATTWITMEPPLPNGTSPIWGRNSCRHCDFPMCAAVCPVEAITKYDEGPVVIDPNVCIGCRYCIYACPWGVISTNPQTGKSQKCTMCAGRVAADEKPFCVHMCPTGALNFGARIEVEAAVEARAQEVGGYVHGKLEAGGTQVLYVLTQAPEQHGLRSVPAVRYPLAKIPLALIVKGPLSLSLGIGAKLRALKSAILHPGRLKYRYWPWRKPEPI